MIQRLILIILITFFYQVPSQAAINIDSVQAALESTAVSSSDRIAIDKVGSVIADIIDVVTTIVQDIMNVTCETQTFLNVFKGSLQNTCTPLPLLNFLASGFIAPNAFSAFMRLSLNNPALLGFDNCSYSNRANYYSPSVSFGMCLNLVLVPNVAINLAKGVYNAFDTAIKTQNAAKGYDAFKNTATLKPDDIFSTQYMTSWNPSYSPTSPLFNTLTIPEGSNQSRQLMFYDFPALPMPIRLKRYEDRVCVIIDNVYIKVKVGCKYMKDPYELSKYAPFKGESTAKVQSAKDTSDRNSTPYTALQSTAATDIACNNLSSCYYEAVNNSLTLLPISSPIINCVQSMLTKVVGSSTVCSNGGGMNNLSSAVSANSQTSAFYSIQVLLRRAVSAVLVLYIMLNGVKLAFGKIGKNEIIMFCLKVILVTYFSIGINVSSTNNFSGMIDWVFPMFFGGLNEIAGWIVGASPSGLCSFSSADYAGKSFALWDALDCRVATYVGLSGITDLFTSLRDSGQYVGDPSDALLYPNLGAVNYSIPPYMLILLPALYSGNMELVSVALTWPILVLAIAAYVVQVSIASMIFIAILGILAPIFVPMALFEFTKGYFNSWAKMFFGLVLQPAITITFVVILFSVYDYGFYGDCKYIPVYVKMPGGATLKSFFIDINSGSTGNCKKTLGWWLSQKYDFSGANQTNGIPTVTLLELNNKGYAAMANTVVDTVVDGAKMIVAQSGKMVSSLFDDNGLSSSPGNFFNIAVAPLKEFFQLCMSMLMACFILYIGFQLSGQLSAFAAELSGGVSLGQIAGNIQNNFRTMKKGVDAAGNAINKLKSGGAGGDRGGANGLKSKDEDNGDKIFKGVGKNPIREKADNSGKGDINGQMEKTGVGNDSKASEMNKPGGDNSVSSSASSSGGDNSASSSGGDNSVSSSASSSGGDNSVSSSASSSGGDNSVSSSGGSGGDNSASSSGGSGGDNSVSSSASSSGGDNSASSSGGSGGDNSVSSSASSSGGDNSISSSASSSGGDNSASSSGGSGGDNSASSSGGSGGDSNSA